VDKALGDWATLTEEYVQPRPRLADHLLDRLLLLGYHTVPLAEGAARAEVLAGKDEIEALARLEHGWWVAEQLLAGWVYGEKCSVENKVSPHSVAWEKLEPEGQKRTREFASTLPAELA
jgi:hypothetical protein